jgi:non-ribosomal peptide synthetase component F
MNKCIESAIGLYGIMKAGGAYVPLDPFAPIGRTGFVIRDCGIRHLLTNNLKLDAIKTLTFEITDLEFIIGVSSDPEISALH